MDNLQVGDVVLFADESGVDHNALVTCVHDQKMINLIVVEKDASKQDSWGRQIGHKGSVSHISNSTVWGYNFRLPGEKPNPRKAPEQS